jgi:hypothetical protein
MSCIIEGNTEASDAGTLYVTITQISLLGVPFYNDQLVGYQYQWQPKV